jgi:hypothetical protein
MMPGENWTPRAAGGELLEPDILELHIDRALGVGFQEVVHSV